MLVLTLKAGSTTQVVGQGSIQILEIRPGSVRIGFEDGAGGELNVLRDDAKSKAPKPGREHRHIGHTP